MNWVYNGRVCNSLQVPVKEVAGKIMDFVKQTWISKSGPPLTNGVALEKFIKVYYQ